MKILSKSTLFTLFICVILGISTGTAQSESQEISNLIAQKKTFNKKNKSSIVYKIQLYNGNEGESYKVQDNFKKEFPDYSVKVVYNKPEFKTQVGNFKTRLEADRILLIIQENFSGAIVLEDKF